MVLVVGATGQLGGEIARRLLAEEHPVRALVRRGARHDDLRAAGAEIVYGDLKERDTLERACRGMAAVITTANSAAKAPPDTPETVDDAGNRALIDAARAEGVEQFIFVSAFGADASSPVPFLAAKGRAEAHLRESGLDHAILSPTVFMDVWIGALVLGPLVTGQPVTIPGEGRRRHSFIAARDVASFAIATLGNPAARNRTLQLGGPQALTWLDVIEKAAAVAGRVIPVRHVQPFAPIPGLPAAVSQIAGAMDTYDSVIAMDGLVDEFGVDLTTVDQFLRAALAR
jgi:uncharacterized protein YbjT (DUF2867 family)